MKIKDIVSIVTPPVKIPNTQYSTSGIYPIIDQGQDYIAGYTNDAGKTITGNFILFGDHTCAVKLSPRTFAQGADGLKILKCKDGLDTGYIYYAIRAMNYNDGKYRRHWSEFKELTLPTPTLSAQRQISTPLLSIDKVINANHKLITSAGALINLIYNYWFVQFDFPDENGRPYKSSGGKMVYNEQLKQEIPEGWEVVDLSDIFSMKQPEQLNKATMSNNPGEHRVYGSNGVIGSYNKYNYADSAIAVSCRGNCGNVYRTMPQSWITGNAMVVTPLSRTSIMHNAYIMLLLRSLNLKSATTGSIQGQITRTNLSRIKTIIPDRNIINSFNNVADTIYDLQIILEDESTKLASLRDWLLPMLMNGQVRINASKEQNNEN